VTALPDRLLVRAASRPGGLVIAVMSGVLALLAIGARTFATFTGGGADMAHHYALVYWFSHHWTLPRAHDAALAEMTHYPPAAHILAALLGRVVGSPFRGMQLVAIAAVVLIWCAIAALLTTLPGRRRWVALAALAAVLALDTSAGPLRLEVHGFEILGNFFFSQVVGQAIVWWLLWFAVRRRLAGRSSISTARPIAIVAVLSTFFHVLPAVELLVLVGCLSAAELLERWRTGRGTLVSYAGPIVLFAATAVAIALTPGFRAMRTLSANNGALDVSYLSGLAAYVGVAIAVAVVSLMLLVVSAVRRDEAATAALLQGLGFAGISVALPFAVQAVSLAAGEGSAYAVKKYIFGLLTVLVLDACVVVAILVPGAAVDDHRPQAAWRFTATVTLTVVATLALFSDTGSGYSVSGVSTLERHVGAVATAEQIGTGGRDYAVALPHSDPVLDYMFSISVLAAPKNQAADAILGGDALRLQLAAGRLITAASSRYDSSTCRRLGPLDGLVVVDAGCWLKTTSKCEAVNVLGQRGLVVDRRLRGFSLAEPTGRWTDGRRASFSCVLVADRSDRAVTIALDATAFLPAGVPRQRVTLAVGRQRKRFVFTPQTPHAVLQLVVPPPTSRRLTLTLILPDAMSPRAAGVSADARELALFVNEIRIG
jgi:hypothetical protein